MLMRDVCVSCLSDGTGLPSRSHWGRKMSIAFWGGILRSATVQRVTKLPGDFSRVLVPLLTARCHEHERVVRQVNLVRAHRAGVELGRGWP